MAIDTTGTHATLGAALESLDAKTSLLTQADGSLTITLWSGKNLIITSLPTTDPQVAGALWNSSATVKVSTGA